MGVTARAGLSPKTVSRVLNGSGPASERTRAAVEAAMRELPFVLPRARPGPCAGPRSGLAGLITEAIPTSLDSSRPFCTTASRG